VLETSFGIDEESMEFDVHSSTLRVNIYPRARDYDDVRMLQLGWDLLHNWKNLERLEVTVVLDDVETAYRLQ